MKSPLRFLILLVSIFVIAHRSPAPIVEEEKPTPAREQAAKPKTKRFIESQGNRRTTSSRTTPTQTPAKAKRFAGTWVGTMQTIPWGNWAVVLTVDANESTMTEQINGEKPEVRPARRNGEMLQARFPAGLTTITWSLTPQPDGTTANVHFEAFMNDFTAVFQRTTH